MTATFAQLTTTECADALFTASLTCGCMPPRGKVMDTVKKAIKDYGVLNCAATVAGEYGDHPVEAVERMKTVRSLVADLPRMTIEQ